MKDSIFSSKCETFKLQFKLVLDHRSVRLFERADLRVKTNTFENMIFYLNYYRERLDLSHLDFTLVSSSKSSAVFKVVIY